MQRTEGAAGDPEGGDRSRRALFRWLGRHQLLPFLLLCLAALAGWGFAELADEVMAGETHAFDTAVLLALRDPADPNDPVGPRWFEEVVRDVSALGGVGVLTLVCLMAIGFLLLQGKFRASLLVAGAIGGGEAVSLLLKFGFDRPRPDLVAHGTHVITSSFPSGHAMMAAVAYLTLGALLARVQPSWSLKGYLLFLSIVLTVLVGASRVYLGVHWPTDVLAGWAAGAFWAVVCGMVARRLQRRGRIERDVNGTEE